MIEHLGRNVFAGDVDLAQEGPDGDLAA